MALLYAVGDSFTYGSELTSTESAWPVLLATALNMDVVNAGKQGASNDYIVRNTINAVSELRPDLVVVAWTSCGRMEFADEYGTYDIWPGCASREFDTSHQHRSQLIGYISHHSDDEYEYRRWLQQVILLQHFLKVQNVNYVMCNAFDNQQRNKKFKKETVNYWNMIDTSKFLGWPYEGIVEWTYGTPHGRGGHPLELGHERIAQKIAEYI
tara:strand:- start:425 stop:1057 length:633 start_codon:yes stop_codon:yes gene_type:complete